MTFYILLPRLSFLFLIKVVHCESRTGYSIDNSTAETGDYTTPLFKLEIGVSDSSGGIECARIAGLRADIIERAENIKRCLKSNKSIEERQMKRSVVLSDKANLHLLKTFLSIPASEWGLIGGDSVIIKDVISLISCRGDDNLAS
jgi:DNA mismatch repair ATPase MutS